LRALGARAGTSHSALVAYEAGRVSPTVDTLERILASAGVSASLTTVPLVAPDSERSRELVDVLELAAAFPARHRRTLEYPVFGRHGN
jgi:transcriptional regulator with XRE-family HTH domain